MGYEHVPSAPARVTATGTAYTTGNRFLAGVVLNGGSDAATAVVRDGGAAGAIVASLKAAANQTASVMFTCPIPVKTDLHVTTTGTAPEVLVYA